MWACVRVCLCMCLLILRKVHYFLFCFPKCSNCPCCSAQAPPPVCWQLSGFPWTQQQTVGCVLRQGSLCVTWGGLVGTSSVILHRAHLAWSRKGTSDRNHEMLPLEVGIGSHTGATLCCHWSSSVFTLISTCHVQGAWHFVSLCLVEQGLWDREPSIG